MHILSVAATYQHMNVVQSASHCKKQSGGVLISINDNDTLVQGSFRNNSLQITPLFINFIA